MLLRCLLRMGISRTTTIDLLLSYKFPLRLPYKLPYYSCLTMVRPTITIRVIDSDRRKWTAAANALGMSISEWIRRRCNSAQPESAGANGSAAHQDLSRVPEGSDSGRRTGANARRGGRSSATDAGRNRCVKRNSEASISVRHSATRDTGELETNGFVTRENFAEKMAEHKPDEYDSWARSLPREVLPSHSATSNRHTCMCTFCLEWRKANSIPYGGPVKKEKKR